MAAAHSGSANGGGLFLIGSTRRADRAGFYGTEGGVSGTPPPPPNQGGRSGVPPPLELSQGGNEYISCGAKPVASQEGRMTVMHKANSARTLRRPTSYERPNFAGG